MRVALVHDWLVAMRGGERCLELIRSMYPNSEIFTLFYDEDAVSEQVRTSTVEASFLSRLPFVKRYYRYLLPIYPLAVHDLSRRLARAHRKEPYDLVISISHCAAKNISVPENVPHLCYCLTPMRYIWDQFEAYFRGRWYEPIAQVVASYLRRWDRNAAQKVQHYVAISEFVAARIEKYYRRQAAVVYPPIDTSLFSADTVTHSTACAPMESSEEDCFLCVNALVPYKNTHLIVEAFRSLPYRLLIVGKGPEEARLRRLASDNVEFLGWVGLSQLRKLYKGAKALVFAAEEDFGMTPVEMQASGRPVIALARGGVLETLDAGGSGLFFSEATPEAIKVAVVDFISRQQDFTVDNCVKQAAKFSSSEFLNRFSQEVDSCFTLTPDGESLATTSVRRVSH